MKQEIPFVFTNQLVVGENDFVIKIPKGVQTTDDLFCYYANLASFPDYFGENWDAFSDCLRDLSWIEQNRIVIWHEDLPLAYDLKNCCIYIELLLYVVNDWKAPPDMSDKLYGYDPYYIEREFLVVFPKHIEPLICDLLSKQ